MRIVWRTDPDTPPDRGFSIIAMEKLTWLAEHPGGTVLPITDAFTLGQGMAAKQFTSKRPACC